MKKVLKIERNDVLKDHHEVLKDNDTKDHRQVQKDKDHRWVQEDMDARQLLKDKILFLFVLIAHELMKQFESELM